MKIKEIAEIIDAKIVCGESDIDKEICCGFASDLMSDVLTLDSEQLVLITGLANMQVIRTAEMADVNCIVFVRDKHVTEQMIEVAKENDMVLVECKYSMFNAIGKLFQAGLNPVY
ncbi:hypothetical protein [Carboxylicivirga linearis]|uniref:DRTGG domain-containing protein n=1 Tax=Carboxylicivirga linearis TaxID=1628157 RepID=A0ABS5JZ31_9BACT|nr:hypothetical protein [Carboxylicivirga linearis]MBS2100162.1 hypothetical protein [Carboxylicivirga linearis]